MSYGARDHIEWWRGAAADALRQLCEEGRKTRPGGIAWREASGYDHAAVGGRKRFEDEWLRRQRSLARMLPQSQRGIIGLLALNPTIEINVPAGPVIRDPHRIAAVQSECERRLGRVSVDPREGDRARHQLARALAAIDPGRPPLIPVPQRTHARPLQVGEQVYTSATQVGAAYGCRGLPAIHSRVATLGFPLVGRVATIAGIVPLISPASITAPHHEAMRVVVSGDDLDGLM